MKRLSKAIANRLAQYIHNFKQGDKVMISPNEEEYKFGDNPKWKYTPPMTEFHPSKIYTIKAIHPSTSEDYLEFEGMPEYYHEHLFTLAPVFKLKEKI
jgi:hypothetical protein